MLRRAAALLAALAAAGALGALEISPGLSAGIRSPAALPSPYARETPVALSLAMRHKSGGLTLTWKGLADAGGTYPAPFHGGFFGPFSLAIEEAGAVWRSGAFRLEAGKLPNRDAVRSPYSLFASGAGLSATLAGVEFDDGFFSLTSRWVGLNRELERDLFNSTDYPRIYEDRGMVYRSYALRSGAFRFGFQDVVVFAGDYFDPDYALIPMPGIISQLVADATGRPLSRDSDDGAFMGFFAEYEKRGLYAYAQVLIDDFNLNRFIDPDSYANPDKVALSAGASLSTRRGRFGLYAAGATRYTFGPTNNSAEQFYPYTYSPGGGVAWEGKLIGIPVEENMVGFLHGENCLALLGSWEGRAAGIDLALRLEGTLSGEKAPAKPWHGESWDGTRWLDDPVLEKRILAGVEAGRTIGKRLSITASGSLGWVQNRLLLVPTTTADNAEAADKNAEPVWRPSGESGLLGSLSLGLSYRF